MLTDYATRLVKNFGPRFLYLARSPHNWLATSQTTVLWLPQSTPFPYILTQMTARQFVSLLRT